MYVASRISVTYVPLLDSITFTNAAYLAFLFTHSSIEKHGKAHTFCLLAKYTTDLEIGVIYRCICLCQIRLNMLKCILLFKKLRMHCAIF